MPSRLKIAFIFLACFFFLSCAGHHIKPTQPKGVYHRVKSGDTLWKIARAYNINIQELAEANNITDPGRIEADSVLFIPDANQVIDDVVAAAGRHEKAVGAKKETQTAFEKKHKEVTIKEVLPPKKDGQPVREPVKDEKKLTQAPPADTDKKAPASKQEAAKIPADRKDKPDTVTTIETPSGTKNIEQKPSKPIQGDDGREEKESIKFDKTRFIWPANGKVISRFGIQPNGMYFNGIKIAAKEGTPVLAAAGGVVIFSAPLRDYGETIIIRHEDNYATVYTNISNRLVKVDDQVKKGREIASLVNQDKKGNAFFNFEIRLKNKARNPLFYLP